MTDQKKTGVNAIEDFRPDLQPGLERAMEGIEFFKQLTEVDVAPIPEPIFREHILPILATRGQQQDLTIWQDVAGHVLRPLEVYDPETEEVLFRVPPILRQVDGLTNRNVNVNGIAQVADRKRQRLQSTGDAHIRKHLVERVPHEPARARDVLIWNDILIRYGYEPILSDEALQRARSDAYPEESREISGKAGTSKVVGYEDL